KFLVVVDLSAGPPPAWVVQRVSRSDLPKRGKTEYLTVDFSLTDGDAKSKVEEISPLLSTYGKIVAIPTSNSLRVSDICEYLLVIDETLNSPAVGQENKGDNFRVYYLVHIAATEAEQRIRDLFSLAPRGSKPPAPPANPLLQMFNRGRDAGGGRGGRGGPG